MSNTQENIEIKHEKTRRRIVYPYGITLKKRLEKVLNAVPHDGKFHTPKDIMDLTGVSWQAISFYFELLEIFVNFPYKIEFAVLPSRKHRRLAIRVGGTTGEERKPEFEIKAKEIVDKVAQMLSEKR